MKSVTFFIRQSFRAGILFTMLFVARLNVSLAQVSSDFETDSITKNTLVASSFINDDEGWLADNAGILWHTTNAAQTWSSISSEKYFLKLDFTDALHGYGITSDAAYKTTDGGITWSALSLPGSVANALYFLDNNTGFISGNEVIYKTTDGGTTWTTVSTEGVSFVDYYFVNSAVGLAAAYDEDAYKCIWRTTDGGSTWSNVYNEENYFITSIWFTDENDGWAAGYYVTLGEGMLPVINHTTNGGLSWENVYINRDPGDIKGEELLDIRFKNELEGFALSTYSQSIITSDGGLTWNFTHNNEGTAIIPDWGIYKTLNGFNDMYLAGRSGYVTKWK